MLIVQISPRKGTLQRGAGYRGQTLWHGLPCPHVPSRRATARPALKSAGPLLRGRLQSRQGDANASVLELSEEDLRRVLDVNLAGPIRLCQLVVPGMQSRGYGRNAKPRLWTHRQHLLRPRRHHRHGTRTAGMTVFNLYAKGGQLGRHTPQPRLPWMWRWSSNATNRC